MTKSVKALLISALVFPGGGHIYLKKHITGAILASVSIFCLYLVFSMSMKIAQDISVKIQTGEIPLDANKITEAIANDPAGHSGFASASTYLLEICWLVGVIDSFRIGRQQDKAAKAELKTGSLKE